MAFSHNDSEVFQRIDWRLLQNGSITMFYRTEVLAEAIEWLKSLDYRLDTFDCSRWDNEEMMLEEIPDKLELDECYGRNLDALNDCLSGIEISESSGRVIVFHRYDAFAAKMPRVAQSLLDIIESNARMLLLFDRRLITLLQSDDPRIRFEPVGARPVLWNWREKFNVSRGL